MNSFACKGIFNIPQIQDAIFSPFSQNFSSPSELVPLLTVCQGWYSMITPYLWSDFSSLYRRSHGGRGGKGHRHPQNGKAIIPQMMQSARWIQELSTNRQKIIKTMAASETCCQLKSLTLGPFYEPILNFKAIEQIVRQTIRLQSFKWDDRVAEFNGGGNPIYTPRRFLFMKTDKMAMIRLGETLALNTWVTLTRFELYGIKNGDYTKMVAQVLKKCSRLEFLGLKSCRFSCDFLNPVVEGNNGLNRLESLEWVENDMVCGQDCWLTRTFCVGHQCPGWLSIMALEGVQLKHLNLDVSFPRNFNFRLSAWDKMDNNSTSSSSSSSVDSTAKALIAVSQIHSLTLRNSPVYSWPADLEQEPDGVLGPLLEVVPRLSVLKLYGGIRWGSTMTRMMNGNGSDYLTDLLIVDQPMKSVDLQQILKSCRNLVSFNVQNKDSMIEVMSEMLASSVATASNDDNNNDDDNGDNGDSNSNNEWVCLGLQELRLRFYIGSLKTTPILIKENKNGHQTHDIEAEIGLLVDSVGTVFEALSRLKYLRMLNIEFCCRSRLPANENSEQWNKVVDHWKLLDACPDLQSITVGWRLPSQAEIDIKKWTVQRWNGENKVENNPIELSWHW